MKKLFSILFVAGIIFPTWINAQTAEADLTELFNKNALYAFETKDYKTVTEKIKSEGIKVNDDYFFLLEVSSLNKNASSTVTLGFITTGDISMQVSNDSNPDLMFLLFSNTGTIQAVIYDNQVYVAGQEDAPNDEKTEAIFGIAYIYSKVIVEKFIKM